LDAETFDRTIDVNVKGTANTMRAFLPSMLEQKRGLVVTISSGQYEIDDATCWASFAIQLVVIVCQAWVDQLTRLFPPILHQSLQLKP
jgi:hypothetical protein